MRELENLLTAALERAQAGEEERRKLEEQVAELKTVSEKKDSFLQNAKMLIKLRDNELAALKAPAKKGAKDDVQAKIAEANKALLQEIRVLKAQVDHHPQVAEMALETFELRNKLRAYEAQCVGSALTSR